MNRQAVTSSNIAEIGYDDQSHTLEVLFLNGSLYQYFEVPPQMHADLLQASSVGQFLNSKIKGNFRYARV